MKTRILMLATAILLLTVSCNKVGDYKCSCTTGQNVVDEQTFNGMDEHTARLRCVHLEKDYNPKYPDPTPGQDYIHCGIY